MPSLRYLLLALLPITSSAFAEERIETFEFESQSAYGPLGNSQNGQIQISLPPGCEIRKLEFLNMHLTVFPPSWASEAGIAVEESNSQYTQHFFFGADSSGMFGPEDLSVTWPDGIYVLHSGSLQIEFIDSYQDPDIPWQCRWTGGGSFNDPFVVEATIYLVTGACCIASTNSCLQASQEECDNQGGVYLGDLTDCIDGGCDCDDPCGQPNCEAFDPCDTTCPQFDLCLCDPWDNECENCSLPNVLCVPGEYATIQEAVDAAYDGDRILISPGNYAGFDLGKPVLVSGIRSAGERPFITPGSCMTVTNGGVLEYLEVEFNGANCSPSGYGFVDGGFISDMSGTIGHVRDCIAHNGTGAGWWASIEFDNCQFLGTFPSTAFHSRLGDLEVNNSLICGLTGILAYTFDNSCVDFTNCLISVNTGNYGDSCFTNCEFFDDCPNSDCNENGIWDGIDIGDGTSQDCNANEIPDECDTSSGYSFDCDQDLVPDECEPDCDSDGFIDDCDSEGDANGNGIPDNCDPDCNGNGIPDDLDIQFGISNDCDADGSPDECQLNDGTATDCDEDGTLDHCQISGDPTVDCDLDSVIDTCAIANGTVDDCNDNNIPDSCDIANGGDSNGDGIVDECECSADIAGPDGPGFPDGIVSTDDLLTVIGYWGSAQPNGDINGDGIVGTDDLLAVISAWGPCE
jgi:hypothetical protein